MDTTRRSGTRVRRRWSLLKRPAPSSTLRRQRIITASAIVLLATTLIPLGIVWWPALAVGLLSPLPIIEAERTTIDETTYEFHLPHVAGSAMVRIGGAPTPIGATNVVENDRYVVSPLYEDLGPLTLVVIDKQSCSQREVSIPEAKFAYALCFDRTHEKTLWIGTTLRAMVYRLDLVSGALRQVWECPDDSHIFGLDQATNGELYLGTHPRRRCWRIVVDDSTATATIVNVNHPATTSTTYLYRVAAADDALLLSYTAPAVLLRHDLQSGHAEQLFIASEPFIDVIRTGRNYWAQNGNRWHGFDQRGMPLGEDAKLPPLPRASIEVRGQYAEVRFGERQTEISLRPRAGGMGLTALDSAGNGRLYGATYWNTWLFEIDPVARRVHGVGALPDGSGEFFHSAWRDGRLLIPSYQGNRYEYNPALPPSTEPTAPNPRLVSHVEQAHYGTASATLPDGSFVYATFPNYHERGGRLIFVDAAGQEKVVEHIGDELTLGQLAVVSDRLFGGTLLAVGSGVAERSPQPPQLIEFDMSGRTLNTWHLDNRDDSVVGLAPLAGSRLLCATLRRLYVIDIAHPAATPRESPLLNRLKRLYDSPIRRLIPYGDNVLIVSSEFLLSYDPGSDRVRTLARLPADCRLAAIGGDGGLYLADREQLWSIGRESLEALGLDARVFATIGDK